MLNKYFCYKFIQYIHIIINKIEAEHNRTRAHTISTNRARYNFKHVHRIHAEGETERNQINKEQEEEATTTNYEYAARR